MSYKLLLGGEGVLRIEDGAFVPNDPANMDWQRYQGFLAEGGTPLPADPAPVPDAAAAQAALQRSAAIEELQRLLNQNATQGEINQAIVNVLSQQ